MFDVYLQSKQPNRRARRLLIAATTLSTVSTFIFLITLWVLGKMGIKMVDPPTIEFVLVQLTDVDAAPPPPPPPPPAGDDSPDEEEVPEDDLIEEELTQPKDTPDKLPEKKKGPKGRKVPGVAGGVPGGVPGGVIGGVVGGTLGGTGRAINTKGSGKKSFKKPFSAISAQAQFMPKLDSRKLAQTNAGKHDRRPGVNVTSFCINTGGKVVKVKTKRKFRGDSAVDKICRDTVKKYRFKPFKVGGKPVEMCTEKTFNIKFK